ncbi:hypothetical protein INT48_006503 [Thamnidium elegans]|uniref:Reverse transcriptase domain-containing protein n=1 Tax=Thamnidium elegans TaxID=101142 RepID=A0A8H7SVM1_9FUNG|nr:hypothetical protein INT48_006503 [Thamnidium elegans]
MLFQIKALQPLIKEVYNQALLDDVSPKSWKDIRVRLLPKKGDLTELKNWRPISLINCDAKIFTRIMKNVKVSTAFRFHPTFIRCIENLFFGNTVQINVNGHLSPIVNQQRGLRQGDPLPPIMFNIALEPLLLSII